VRRGYAIAVITLAVCAPLLIIDLTQPGRFWHMLFQSDAGGVMFKWWSPMSYGTWIISLLALFVFLSLIGAFARGGMLPRGLAVLTEGALGNIIAAITGILGLFMASYTGLLAANSNRPLWGDTTLLGLLFLMSGVSAGAAAMILVGWGRDRQAISWLSQMDSYSMIIELVVLAIMVASLGAIGWAVLGNGWGIALLVGTVLLGILVPLYAHLRPRLIGAATLPLAAVLVLVGSFVLRAVIVLAAEAVA
ncbi:MAG: polysulfide reductase NrfD, partial [Thermomicrobiales bacterium]|nr:polysulfide reductase NrfD [Thermomicrobiales bacterium]